MKCIGSFFKSIAVAFSIYSKIPMPRFKWASEDMKYHLVFFPCVGAVIGCAEWLWYELCVLLELSQITFALIVPVIIFLITGGLHLDGFMDTCDALHSYQQKERKLEILKDPHIGAFSVICLLAYMSTMVAFSAEIIHFDYANGWLCVCIFFVMSRCMSGISALSIDAAREDGMLKSEADNSNGFIVKRILMAELCLAFAGMVIVSYALALVILVCQVMVYLIFKKMCVKEFGGITGDLAGYLLCISELITIIMTVLVLVLNFLVIK